MSGLWKNKLKQITDSAALSFQRARNPSYAILFQELAASDSARAHSNKSRRGRDCIQIHHLRMMHKNCAEGRSATAAPSCQNLFICMYSIMFGAVVAPNAETICRTQWARGINDAGGKRCDVRVHCKWSQA